jgi:hypothetical protein
VGPFEKLGTRDWRSEEPQFARIIGTSQALESVLEQLGAAIPLDLVENEMKRLG